MDVSERYSIQGIWFTAHFARLIADILLCDCWVSGRGGQIAHSEVLGWSCGLDTVLLILPACLGEVWCIWKGETGWTKSTYLCAIEGPAPDADDPSQSRRRTRRRGLFSTVLCIGLVLVHGGGARIVREARLA